MPIRSLLVPVDYDAEGDRALPVATRLACAAGIPIELITVSTPGLSEEADVDELSRRVAAVKPASATWSIIHDEEPAAAIVRAIEDRPDALPVIGTAARGPLGELLLGSASEQILGAVDRPILFVGPEVDPDVARLERFLVAVSSWGGSEPLLDAVADLVAAFPASVEVVEVLPPHRTWDSRGLFADANLVRGMADALENRDIEAQWEVVNDDDPGTRIATLAREERATIIVAPTTRWATRRRIHPHSTVRQIVRSADAPVLVVPHPA